MFTSSAVSRAILKSVYQSQIPNSDTQTLKSVKINSSKNRQWTFHTLVPQHLEPQEGCFELLRMQISKNPPRLCSWTPLGRACSTPSRLPSCTMVFLVALVKKLAAPQNCWIWHWLAQYFKL